MSDFASLRLPSELLQVVAELGYATPTPVQAACIPILLSGRDLIGQSRTGSGKTVAFGLPLLAGVDLDRRVPQALVLCPTRELCAQVARELRTLGRRLAGLGVLESAGGQPIARQLAALERGVHVVVATPGRLLDHLGRASIDVAHVGLVVLDEGDRMLDMGFGPEVEEILGALGGERQTALFSATFPGSIEQLAGRWLRRPERVTVVDDQPSGPAVRQLRVTTDEEHRFEALCRVLADHPHESALIFCNYKASVVEVASRLAKAGLSVARLDGDLDQFRRDQVLARFRNRSVRLLVATDVAGRGLDVEGLDLVVNHELPHESEIYLHRIGRTGRAGRPGLAVSLTTGRQEQRVVAIQRLTGVPIEELAHDSGRAPDPLGVLAERARPAPMATLMISGGRRDKLRKGDILGALTGEAGGLAGDDIGRIEVHDHISYVAVERRRARHAAQQLGDGQIKGRRFKVRLVGGGA